MFDILHIDISNNNNNNNSICLLGMRTGYSLIFTFISNIEKKTNTNEPRSYAETTREEQKGNKNVFFLEGFVGTIKIIGFYYSFNAMRKVCACVCVCVCFIYHSIIVL
jgi:hypothetical protein